MGRSGFIVVPVAAIAFMLACKSSTSDGTGGAGAGNGGTGTGQSGSGASGSGSGGGGSGSGGGASGGTGGGSATAGTGGGMAAFDAGTAPDRNMVKAGEVCARLTVIQCAGEVACCTAPKETVDACMKMATQSCNGSASLDVVSKAAAVGFDPTAAAAAFTELERRASKCDPSIAAWAVSTDGFQRSFTGTLASAADCTPTGGFMGSTGDIAIALASCRLADGLACLPGANMTDKWTCAARAANAGRCYTDLNCQEGLYCENPQATSDGKCTPRKAAGMACNNETECTSFLCKSSKCAAADDVQAAYCYK